MPSSVGGVKINSISSSGVLNFGDLLISSPKDVSKSYAGSGSSITGDFAQTNNGLSRSNTKDTDINDQNISSP